MYIIVLGLSGGKQELNGKFLPMAIKHLLFTISELPYVVEESIQYIKKVYIHIYQHKVSTNLLVINNRLEMVIKGQNIALELLISLNCKGCIRASCSILATDSCMRLM